MKTNQLLSIFLALLFFHVAAAQPVPIVTRDGATYQGAKVDKVDPDGLTISYTMAGGGMGMTKLKFADLPDGLQQKYGYNSTNATAFENNQKAAEGEWRAKLIANDQEDQSKRHGQEIADAETRAKWVGTGFFITDNGYLLTCFHVVNHPATSIQVGTTRGLYNAELVQSDPDKDVALLKVTGTFSSLPLVLSNAVNFGEAVFTIGFPDPEAQGWQPKLTRGEISSLSGFRDNANEYQISVPVQPGNSGGALIDEQGNVVGIVEATLTVTDADLKAGIVPQNVNYAIKSSCARTLLDSMPDGSLKIKPPNLSDYRRFEQVVQTSEDAVALVLVQ